MIKPTDKRSEVMFVNAASSFAILPCLIGVGDALNENVSRLSITVNVVVAVLVLPAASVAVIVIVCIPTPTTVPASGLCVIVTGPALSVAVVSATTSGIVACPLALEATVVGAGAVIKGATVSLTVIDTVAA